MAKGQKAEIGDERTAPNGYQYVKVDDAEDPWKLKHWIIAERSLGRPIRKGAERVKFIDGDRTNLAPSNIEVVPLAKGSTRRRIAQLEARRDEIDARIAELKENIP